MKGYVEESEEVKTFRNLLRAAEARVGAGLLGFPYVDTETASENLKRAALAYAAAVNCEGAKEPRKKR